MLRISHAKRISGSLAVPGDKSISHRALMLGALANGVSRFTSLANSADVASTASVLASLGVRIERAKNGSVVVHGNGIEALAQPNALLDCGNSGTTARLMAGILAASHVNATLIGDESLSRRPMQRVAEPLRLMGAYIDLTGERGTLPMCVSCGRLHGIDYTLPVASAQVKSAVLLAGLFAWGETIVREPALSRDHTETMLRAMGAQIRVDGHAVFVERSRLTPLTLDIPGDFSSASFLLGLAAMHQDAEVTITGVNLNPRRTGFLDALRAMGAVVDVQIEAGGIEPSGTVRVRSSALRAVTVIAEQIPAMIDELPMLAVVATQATGRTVVSGAGELRHKETDRIAALCAELRKMGASVEELPDGFAVTGPAPLKTAALDGHGDHRIAMALACAAACAEGESALQGDSWVRISWPGFFEELTKLGVPLRG